MNNTISDSKLFQDTVGKELAKSNASMPTGRNGRSKEFEGWSLVRPVWEVDHQTGDVEDKAAEREDSITGPVTILEEQENPGDHQHNPDAGLKDIFSVGDVPNVEIDEKEIQDDELHRVGDAEKNISRELHCTTFVWIGNFFTFKVMPIGGFRNDTIFIYF